MLKIINSSLQEFRDESRGKHLYIWGAGAKGKLAYEEWGLQNYAVTIIDSNEHLQGKRWEYHEEVMVCGKDDFIQGIRKYGIENARLLITPSFFGIDIIEELDQEQELDGLKTYVLCLIAEFYQPQSFELTKGEEKIPRKIHYFWFGGKGLPDQLKEYIDTWKKYCPDYEIVEWNESNYDVTKNSYMYEAYQCKKYGFVPDYARLDVLYHNGGIYLDTDIEVFQPFDDLLCDNSFFSADYEGSVNTGSGFGTVPFNPIIKSMMDVYEDKHFLKEDGTMALEPCQHYSNPVLKNYGFAITPKYQNINGNVIYPSEVFAPIGMYTGFKHFTDKTHSLHYGNYSWGSEEEKAGKERFKREIVSRLNQ